MRFKLSRIGHHPDYFLLAVIFLLIALGLVILTSASSELGKLRYNDSYYFLKHQLLYGLLGGLIGFIFTYYFHYENYKKLAFVFLLLNIGLLAFVFTNFGVSFGGASRWLRIGPVAFQPSELLKITYILYLAAWLSSSKTERMHNISEGLLPFLIISGLMASLLILQPATSMVMILLLTGGVMYFLSGISWKNIFIATGLGLAVFAAVIYSTPYRLQRITTFLNPEKDPQGSGYQINQALIAIGSGGWSGVGYGKSATKGVLPAPMDDSIFAIAAQELGFIGSTSLVILFAALVYRLTWLARRVRDRFGFLILMGFAFIIAFQSVVNIAAISGFIPLTGIPLPFVSYGGTALAVFITMSGVAINISKYA